MGPLVLASAAYLGRRRLDMLLTRPGKLPGEPAPRPPQAGVGCELEEMEIPPRAGFPGKTIDTFARLVLPYGRGQDHPRFAAFVNMAAPEISMPGIFAGAGSADQQRRAENARSSQ